MPISPLAMLTALLMAGPAPEVPETAADAITLRDGEVLLGQVVEPASKTGGLVVMVRRAWATAHLADWAARWQASEAASLRRARTQRRERLTAWRRERGPTAPKGDRILAWIDGELARLAGEAGAGDSPLMLVKPSRGDVRGVVRRPKATARMLRQGWLSGFADVETLPTDVLAEALEGRGFSPEGRSPVSVDALLPVPSETDAQWLARRAATEVANDPGLKFLATGGTIMPEPEPGQHLALGGAVSALADLKSLLEDRPRDPLAERLADVEARGRVGAVVTRLQISPDLSAVRVESALWVRRGKAWGVATSRMATVRPDALPRNAGEPLAEDPQVKIAFDVVVSLGAGRIPDDVKRRSLRVGAATQKALGQVRSALLADLNGLVLPVLESPEEPAKP